jgi:hypothetical protein
LLVAAGVIVFVMGGGKAPVRDAASSAPATADVRTARALKLPPRPLPVEKAAAETSTSEKPPEKSMPERTVAVPPVKPEPIAVPTPATAPAASAVAEPEKKTEATKPEPGKAACKVDLTRWPTEKSDQAQAVQMLLRDLGYYRGTTNGTVGPQTRTAIREFQAAVGEGETGEIAEALFEALKKKCAGSP